MRRLIAGLLIALLVSVGGGYFGSEKLPERTKPSESKVQELQKSLGAGKGSTSELATNNCSSRGSREVNLHSGVHGGGTAISRGGIDRGIFLITAYTAGKESTGKDPGDNAYGITASGVKVKEGVTVSADWEVLPGGTVIEIDGVGRRVVQDTGGAIKGNRIDLYFDEVEEAIKWGRQHRKVKVVEWGS